MSQPEPAIPQIHTAELSDTEAEALVQGVSSNIPEVLTNELAVDSVDSSYQLLDLNLETNPVSKSAAEFLQVGGPVVWVLMTFSVAAVAIGLVKIWQFYRAKAERVDDIDASLQAWAQGDVKKAESFLVKNRPLSQLVLSAQKACDYIYCSGLVGVSNQNDALKRHKEELTRLANELMQNLRSYLRPLEMIATLSPLLGLLGTVMGMIEAFQQMESAGSQVDPSVLSGGIWQALLTTAVGLSVAIPVVMLHGYLERKCERITYILNDSVTRVFTQMPHYSDNAEQGELAHAA
ncbi:MotA/TolQ/ExbB proton channel family protein [Alkalimarinus alittae]|uniref:MotA/TolQ/ExbB proton channel family protein n=1 Tax=Alkalimarinus alittae TaxID=2961619 RepID=A0ABY6MXL5_9ALTE|nr:MotA/TolQ/ExbB proton channel family protein [Alkalimarinus alittae]UZE94568.1 MotA/TolQ/ExbB proton channel family protein [Alkalimarinus alittae]